MNEALQLGSLEQVVSEVEDGFLIDRLHSSWAKGYYVHVVRQCELPVF